VERSGSARLLLLGELDLTEVLLILLDVVVEGHEETLSVLGSHYDAAAYLRLLQSQGLQIELKPEIGVGVYANLALITHSSSDFILDFTCMLPGLQQPQVRSRVVMAPEHAKRLLMALNDNIQKYEQNFGKIQLPEQQQPRTATPFHTQDAEA
jgi:hypothetical protein